MFYCFYIPMYFSFKKVLYRLDWKDKFLGQIWPYEVNLHAKISHLVIEIIKFHHVWPNPEQFSNR